MNELNNKEVKSLIWGFVNPQDYFKYLSAGAGRSSAHSKDTTLLEGVDNE